MILKPTYKDKIRDLRNGAQETQAATKIRDKLTELRSKDVVISSYRWIWELIQNAKDCPNSSGKIDIEINFNSARRIVEFKHNGKLFSTKNIVYLIEQVSTKERTSNSKSTGKFGTGFLTTNLLSPLVTISGLIDDEDDTGIAQFEVTLDRSGDDINELKASIKNSCEQLENNTNNISYAITGNEMNTTFCYALDDNGIQAAQNGLDNFLITAPYVFAFVSELNKITINKNGIISEYARTQHGVTRSENVFVSRIRKNNDATPINILFIKDETLMLAAEIIRQEDTNYVAPYNENLPKLFCDFPLLGTHDFSFPVVINSKSFDPNEPRNGIILYGNESAQNKSILKKACSLYASLIDYFIENDYKDIHNAVCLPAISSKDWIDVQWYEEAIISLLKDKISKFQMFVMADGSKQTLQDTMGSEQNIFLSSDDTKEIRNAVWGLSSQLFPHKHVCFNDIDNWYNSLWDECRNYGVIELISEVEEIGSLENLSKKVPDAINWLKELYDFIYKKCSDNIEVTMRANRIFPNQNGKFCCLNDLKVDGGIDNAFKEAAELISIDLKSELLDIRIPFEHSTVMYFNDAADRMFVHAQKYGVNSEQFYKHIIGICKNAVKKQLSFIDLYNSLFTDDPIIIINDALNYDDRLLTNALEYWCKKICDDIAQCNFCRNFCERYSFDLISTSEMWLSEFVEYLRSINHLEWLEQYAIIPNQNDSFKSASYLYYEADSIPEFVKDVCRISGTDLREELASVKINVSGIIPRKKGYKDVSTIITSYIREHMNNIRVSSDEKESFNKTYMWLRNQKDDPVIKQHFEELLNHLYWFYNDDEISESISKANELDDILSKFGITDIKQLEVILTQKENESQLPRTITEELLCQYGISSKEEFQRLIDSKILDDNFLHYINSSIEKFIFVQQILQRTLTNIKNHLSSLQGYDLNDSVAIHKTIFTAKKDGREIYIIARPSDYDEVILYYDAEIQTLDYTKDFELWIEDGRSTPEQLTFGKIIRLTGVNRIPLRRIK